jgi:seryl-tRNA synthetase
MIDYAKIAYAVAFYKRRGFEYREVPWLLDLASVEVAAPEGTQQFNTFAGYLPASGEQSFHNMMIHGRLTKGRYQTVTPCFRDEAIRDHWTMTHFLKLELIDLEPQDLQGSLDNMVNDAAQMMRECGVQTERVNLPDGSIDLVSTKGIELGSYGVRHIDGFSWVYGTGLAEPRFSRVLEEGK